MEKKQIFVMIMLSFALLASAATERIHQFTPNQITFRLFEKGQPPANIVISANASIATQKAAQWLAETLSQLSGVKFNTANGNGDEKNSIVFGSIADFPQWREKQRLNPDDPGQGQGYLIESISDGLLILGATDVAMTFAASDFLARLGYRMYLPKENWTITPKLDKIEFSGKILESPDFYHRWVWPNWGPWNPAEIAEMQQWIRANRDGGFAVANYHIYDTIIEQHTETFRNHPEYLGLVNGKRTSSKFCIANHDLRRLVIEDAIDYFKKNPTEKTISREPSDGGDWCECEACMVLGSISDRALLLANESAQALRDAGIRGKLVGLLGYNFHSPPPSFDVDRDVVVNVANGFIKGGYTFDELVQGWAAKQAVLGTYDYFSIYIWNFDLPGAPRIASVAYLEKFIPELYRKNVRYFVAESTDSWGIAAFGHFFAEQMLWNIDNATRAEVLEAEFLRDCFGPAATTMKEFYRLMLHAKPILSDDLLARLYGILVEAKIQAAGNSPVLKRLADLGAYVRYCELYMLAKNANNPDAMRNVRSFVRDIASRRMIHTPAVKGRGKEMLGNGQSDIDWNNAQPVSDEMIWYFVDEGVKKYKKLPFETVSFSDKLIPVKQFSNLKTGGIFKGDHFNRHRFFLHVPEGVEQLEFDVTGGLVEHYRAFGNVQLTLTQVGGSSVTGEKHQIVATDRSVPPDGKMRKVIMKVPEQGTYYLDMNGNGDISRLNWNASLLASMRVGLEDQPVQLDGNHQSFYFYIPRDTEVLGMYIRSFGGKILSMKDELLYEIKPEDMTKIIGIPLKKEQTGQLYKIVGLYGDFALLTVPPYLSCSPNGLLLPAEVVEKDFK